MEYDLNIVFNNQSLDVLGNVSGVNFWAAPMLPLIFILPCMKAVWGLSFLSKRATASSSVNAKVASALPSLPFLSDPLPFLRSRVQTTGGCPLAGAI